MLIIEYAIERSKLEILQDIASGVVPGTVSSFSELHDYVDANEYGGLCAEGTWFCLPDNADTVTIEANGGMYLLQHHIDQANGVQNAVDAWLKDLNPEQAQLDAELNAIHPFRTYYMYRGKPLGHGPHHPVKWCDTMCSRCESLWVSKMETDLDI
jgi:hypothetical protein